MKTEILRLLRESEGFLSGQQLCSRFQVSRAAVWKVMEQLKDEGYEIQAVRNKGYRLVGSPDVLSREELESRIGTRWAGHHVVYFPQTDSTNLQAKAAGEAGSPHGSLFVTDRQSAGRGRRGRAWESPGGENIYMTLLLRPEFPPERASMLTLVMALAAAEGIETVCGGEVGIKWPNDLVLKGKKICGILTEMSAEVDYIVKGIDQEHNVVAASRLEAMALKRREYYFRTDRDGNYQIYEGIRAEARVISVIRAGIFVDLFGAECYIPLRELSYQRWVDAAQHYQPGQRVLVRVLEVDRSDRSRPRVTASVKQAMENPYEKALKKYVVGNRYVGTVSMVDLNGVFVSLDGGIDCLCTYPKRGRPPRGARATVRILGINHENNRIWGVITHMSTTR